MLDKSLAIRKFKIGITRFVFVETLINVISPQFDESYLLSLTINSCYLLHGGDPLVALKVNLVVLLHIKKATVELAEQDMETGSLFRVVDACSVEATVLSNAEKRTRNATIPSFNGTDSLGFGAKSLRNFCATADAVVLGMASEATKQEGQKLRERGVANLIARDRVHMKEQILRGLLLRLWKQDNGLDSFGDANNPGAASTTSGNKITSAGLSNESPPSFDSHMDHREDLIKVGAVTPFDDLESHPTSGVQTRGRMTLMDHKIAEGMKVKLPRSFCRGAKETVSSGGAQNRNGRDTDTDGDHEKGNEHDAYPSISDSKNPRGTNASSSGYSGDEQHESKDCKNESPQGKSDTDSRNGWVCEACTLVCPGVMVCLDCGKRRPRTKHFLADSCRSHENGVTSILGHSNVRDARSTSGMTDDRHKRRNTRRLSAKIINRRSEIKSRSDPGPEDKKRDVGSRTSRNSSKRAYQNIASVAKTGIELRAAGGGQLLVDDYSDVDFEARKAQGLANAPVIDDSDSSALRMTDFGDGLKMNGAIVQRLFQFQVTGVRWMWQLHKQGAGGIVGDEMGLGKTVQVSAFLGALYDSNVMRRALVVCPATVLSHWMAELHEWAPQMRVVILHRCAHAFNAASGSSGKIRTLVRQVFGWSNVVVVTSYEGLKSLKASLLPCDWDYAILDEGQRIRNPDAEVTLISKQIRTVHRLVLTGTPIQNNLRELWSLFDFVFPGRLGALPAFEAEFSSPIRVGGYANASPMQARLAYRCALVLRDLIHPYLLRRQKKDLKEIIRLPAKTEQVLFCRLTLYQRRLYSEFLQSAEVKDVLRRTTRSFRAITILRKLCNHPDLVCNVGDSLVSRLDAQNLWGGASDQSEYDAEDVAEESEHHEHGAAQRSGKLLVLQQILPLWHKQGHRVLLFSQTRQMLNIVERFLEDMAFSYGRLDGNTPVSARQTLINRFNSDESIFVMLLTTRTGGVGVNLTGADRVILFDPDWNPSTDMQARERSWRVGQARQVTIYRLITTGTIEEKIYHRQIFKTALTNRVLQDPKQRRLFSADELGDLFTLGEDCSLDGLTDTVDLFQGEGKVNVPDRGDQSQSGSTRDKSDGISRKRVRKQSRKVQLDKPAPLGGKRSEPYETPPNPSALIGTATVALEPAAGSSAKPTVGPDEPKNDKSKSDDQAVLQALYDGAPLSSVFQHDFAEGSGVSTVEHKRMEEVAKRAAQKALNQLRMSRRTLRAGAGQGGFQSSWTGRNGGSPENTIVGENMNDPSQNEVIRRFGTVTNPGSPHGTGASSGSLTGSSTQSRSYFDSKDGGLVSERGSSGSVSSQDILRQIRSRNGSRQPSLGLLPELHDSGTSQDKDAYYASLLERVQDFLAQAPSGVDTAALIHTFSDVRPADVPVFRQLLQAIAVCNNGEWTLRVARDD